MSVRIASTIFKSRLCDPPVWHVSSAATDPDAPLWRFVFQPEMGARDALGQTQYDLRYRVEIASPAGDVASAEAFKRQVPVYDLSYLMNLY